MTRELFLFKLTQQLNNLPKEERDRTREFYSEMIADRMEDGMDEADAVAALGDPESIARDVIQSYRELNASLPVATESQKSALRSVSIDDPSGDIAIRTGAASGAYELLYENCAAEDYILSEENGALVIRYIRERETKIHFSLFKSVSNDRRLTLILPNDLETLNVRTSSGDISAESLNVNALTFSTASGDIRVQGVHCAEDASLSSASGDMELNDLTAARLETRSVSGDLRFDSVSASEDARLQTRSGDVAMDRFESDTLFAEAISGDLNLNALKIAHSLTLSVISGDVRLRDCNAESCAMKTISGDIQIGELHLSGVLEAALTSGDFELSGASVDQIRLSTISGDLVLARAQVNRDLSANSQAGDLRLKGVSADRITLATNNGDIQGTLCAIDGDYAFHAKSSIGDVRAPETHGRHVVTASSSFGDIALRVE